MQVLHYEVVNLGMDNISLTVVIVLSVLVGVCFYLGNRKVASVIIPLILIVIALMSKYLVNEQYEYQKVIVEDWNVVHSEGWEVDSQEGEITVLKRKLEEK